MTGRWPRGRRGSPERLERLEGLFKVSVHVRTETGNTTTEVPITQFLTPEYDIPQDDAKLVWLHVPSNDMEWVEAIMEKYYHPDFSGLEDSVWRWKSRPSASHVGRQPLHSRHMEACCMAYENETSRKSNPLACDQPAPVDSVPPNLHLSGPKLEEGSKKHPLLSLYLPYMNWELYSNFTDMCKTKEGFQSYSFQLPGPDCSVRQAMEGYISSSRATSFHPRRTLYQYHYAPLNDMTDREADQTIPEWTGNHMRYILGDKRAEESALTIMVDQLWCWVLDHKTVLSFFPSGDVQYQNSEFIDLYQSISQGWLHCDTVWDLYATIAGEAADYLFRPENRNFTDLIGIYKWVIDRKIAHQRHLFDAFRVLALRRQFISQDTKPFHSPFISRFDPHLPSGPFENHNELKLITDLVSISDELKIIRSLLDKQRDVIKSLIINLRGLSPSQQDGVANDVSHFIVRGNRAEGQAFQQNIIILQQNPSKLSETIKILAGGISGTAKDTLIRTDESLDRTLREVEAVSNEAEIAHQQLFNLLDLKQKDAALMEARATTQQGRVIMLFTVITIIFLPLSFFTSYFGQNVSELTGDDKNPTSWAVWKYGAAITLSIVVSALLVAYYIAYPQSQIWFWIRRHYTYMKRTARHNFYLIKQHARTRYRNSWLGIVLEGQPDEEE
ncbi:hypothetical protein F4778DRAFT_167944 [Xylariomycetidae sp. FL2044]|nr:hypothetical protein F4778DRAFT_167944 [Xylariomycetidae sp. FL2044]